MKNPLLILFACFIINNFGSAQNLEFTPATKILDHPLESPQASNPFIAHDYNNDGIMDLSGGNWYWHYIYEGVGNNEFADRLAVERSRPVKNMDFDNDGIKDDFLSLKSVVIHYGNDTFQLIDPTDFHDVILESADFDLDGYNDLIILYNEANDAEYIEIAFNEDNSTFTSELLYDKNPIHSVALGDIDNDGDVDIFVALHSGPIGVFLLNNGDGEFEERAFNPAVQVNRGNADLADLDNDGDLDLIMFNDEGIITFANTDNFLSHSSYATIPISAPFYLEVADFNNDDYPDFAVAFDVNLRYSRVSVIQNNTNFQFSSPIELYTFEPYGGAQEPYNYVDNNLYVFDTDFDGDMDVLLTDNTRDEGAVMLMENQFVDQTSTVRPNYNDYDQISVSPNPVKDQIMVKSGWFSSSITVNFSIFSSNNILVHQGQLNRNSIQVDHLHNGVYHIIFWTDDHQNPSYGSFIKSD